MNTVLSGIGLTLAILMLMLTGISLLEHEARAAKRAFGLALILPIPYLVMALVSFPYKNHFGLVLVFLSVGIVVVVLIPARRKRIMEDDSPRSRLDERDVIFSRRLLAIGSEQFNEYYRNNPGKKILDDSFRTRPGLLAPTATYFEPLTFASASASFIAVDSFKHCLDGTSAGKKVTMAPEKITRYLKNWSVKLGGVAAGVTELKDYHFYSHIGRGDNYGQPIEPYHKYGIAITVAMTRRMMASAPAGPTVMESAQQYLASGAIAVQVAAFIRELGYAARAHIDANYHVVCPLIARDAGLGEIGRMGLLMTPHLGPRVRIAVVTTDLPLIVDNRPRDNTMIDFCSNCSKCASVCPVNAIPFDDRKLIDGVKRWQINSEACFTYWCTIGTDCGRCVLACPHSHPNNLFHNFIRWMIHNSFIFRKLAVPLDDFFYGKKPAPLDLPEWMKM